MIATSTAKEHWERNPDISFQELWTGNPLLGEAVYRRMSGGESSEHWLAWLFRDYYKNHHFERVLSPGCGTGSHEIVMMSFGNIHCLDAFDFSESCIRLAREKASSQNIYINFYIYDINNFQIPVDRKYDMVFCSGSVHHVREIERFFRVVRDALLPDGVFIFNEYVGPCYNIYPQHQLDIINRLLRAIAPEFRRADRLDQNTVEQVLASDASESVRSSLILPFAATYFDFEICRPMGGTVLHPLYPLLNHERMSRRTPEVESILRLLIEFEEILIKERVLETDFVLCVCRKN